MLLKQEKSCKEKIAANVNCVNCWFNSDISETSNLEKSICINNENKANAGKDFKSALNPLSVKLKLLPSKRVHNGGKVGK